MIINEFRKPTESAPDLYNICTQACPPLINPCDFFVEDLKVNLSANHGCDRAEYDIYLKSWKQSVDLGKSVWLYITSVNLNTFTHNRTIGGNNPALAEFTIPKETVIKANEGKAESRNRELCCYLDMYMYPGYHPGNDSYKPSTVAPTLPFENDENLWLPPVEREDKEVAQTIQLQQKVGAGNHANIVKLTIVQGESGASLISNQTWNGEYSLDLCKGTVVQPQLPREPVKRVDPPKRRPDAT